MQKITTKKIVLTAITGVALVASQMATAHTRLQTPTIDENSAFHGSDYNNEVIGHGCKDETGASVIDTIATVVVFPDGKDSSITVDGEAVEQDLTDFVSNYGSPMKVIQSNDVFTTQESIKDDLGNSLGYYAYGNQLKAGFTGLIPFRTSGVIIEPTSCAKTVKFIVAIADICEVTSTSGFSDSTVMLWTPSVGSIFDGGEDLNGYNSPASLTVSRTSDMPESCGDGVDVVVTHSAAQLDRDMTIEVDGTQVWPTE